jgi:hypothetical protein
MTRLLRRANVLVASGICIASGVAGYLTSWALFEADVSAGAAPWLALIVAVLLFLLLRWLGWRGFLIAYCWCAAVCVTSLALFYNDYRGATFTLWLVCGSGGLVLLLLAWRRGWRVGLWLMLPFFLAWSLPVDYVLFFMALIANCSAHAVTGQNCLP